MKKGIKCLILLLAILSWLPVAHTETYECFPYTYDAGKGCSLIRSALPYGYYASGMLNVGYYTGQGITKAFIRWDLSSVTVPAGYHVESATYTPHITFAPAGATQNSMGVYRVLQPWDVDLVCWNEYDWLIPWNTAGCEAASDAAGDGGAYDRAATPLDMVILMLPGAEDTGTTAAPPLWIGPDDSSASLIERYGGPYNAHTGHMGYYPDNGIMRFIINWDLDTIPDDLEIVSASLNLTTSSQVVQGSGSHTVEIYRIVGAYAPMYCSWTNKDTTTLWDVAGAVGGSEIDTAPFTTFDWPWGTTSVDVDITDAIKNWKDGTWDNYGVLLKFSDESTNGPYYSVQTNGSSTGQSGVVDVVYENPSLTMDLTLAVQNWVDGAWDNNGVVFIAEDNINESGYRQMNSGSTDSPHPLIVTVVPDTVTDPPHETCGSLDVEFSSYATDDMNYWIEKKDEMTGSWKTASDTITTDKDNTSGSLTYVVTGDTTTAPAAQDKQFYRVRREDALQYP